MTVSIIIPTYNEGPTIGKLIRYLRETANGSSVADLLVSDGQSTDDTLEEARKAGARVLVAPSKGRAAQMNAGAAAATGDVLYFLHADTFPPRGFVEDILRTVEQGHHSGCYQLRFDHAHWFLRLNGWFTRFESNSVRFGDQSLFVLKEVFWKLGGFREDLVVMEDQEIIERIRKHADFIVLSNYITTSARKYLTNGIYRTQAIFFLIWSMYQLGFSQHSLVHTYQKLLRPDKAREER